MAVGYQSFYQAQLTANISDTDTVIPVDVAPTPSEGFLVIESTVTAKREIIYYTSKTTNSVTVPSGAGNGRGYDGTTATSHLQGAAVIMAPVGAMFDELRTQFTTTPQGWTSIVPAVSTVTANGNRSYNLTFASTVASTLSPGMRLKLERTVAAPTTAFSLDGSNDYYSKTSPTGLSFTTTFTCSAWVYATAYHAGGIIARRNVDTEGWALAMAADGRIQLIGLRIAANNKAITSYQSIPLNRWVHVAATIDMAVADTSAQKIWIDGVEVPRSYTLTGTATALVQGTTALVVGALKSAGTDPFPGYIDQAAVFSSQLSDATIKAMINQGLSGSESTLVSAFSNGSTTDLNTTNANNLTAQNGATTVASAPWGNRGLSTTLDYGLVMAVDGTDVTVQVPEGCTIPTTGGITSVSYSTQANPYGWVSDKGRWYIKSQLRTASSTTSNATYGSYISGGYKLNVPIGKWIVGQKSGSYYAQNVDTLFSVSPVALTGLNATTGGALAPLSVRLLSPSASSVCVPGEAYRDFTVTTATDFVMYTIGATTVSGIDGQSNESAIYAIPSSL